MFDFFTPKKFHKILKTLSPGNFCISVLGIIMINLGNFNTYLLTQADSRNIKGEELTVRCTKAQLC